MELQSITEALEQLGRRADGIVPLFITVDPRRDTVEVMADYAGHFHPIATVHSGGLLQCHPETSGPPGGQGLPWNTGLSRLVAAAVLSAMRGMIEFVGHQRWCSFPS